MKTNLFVVMIFLFPFFKAQSTCHYIETSPKSKGYICIEDILIFTSSVNTTVQGSISARDQILLEPTPGYGIIILPPEPCNNCTEPTNNDSTIGTKKGNGKDNNNRYNNLQKPQDQEIVLARNPVDQILELSLKKGLITKIIIFDYTGKTIVNKNNIENTEIQIDVSKLPKGIYGVKTITNNNQTFTKQFIKN